METIQQHAMKSRVIALTGGIGSGKSTAANIFSDLGVPVLDLDQVGHGCLNDVSVKEALVACFGLDILDENQSIQRKTLAARAFAHSQATEQLNHIMHPAILQQEQTWISEQSTQQCTPYVIIEASALLESKGEKRMDAIVVLMADLEIRRQRVMQRGEQDNAAFERILACQCDDALRREKADYILENSGEREELLSQIIALHQQWMHHDG